MELTYSCAHCGAELRLDDVTGNIIPCEIHPNGQITWHNKAPEPVDGGQ